jgi:tetratricopeptide (TPR) repeat protein
MAFNKSKALESALKFMNQGRLPDAIREYQGILRMDPRDQVTLMTLGDLFVRQADLHQATEYFERLANVYLNDGFNSKAIAIYKKIAKLAPNELDPLERLADLYVQQGVLSEARPLFLQIAEGHLKANRAQRAVEVLRRLLEVEPENLRVQMRLAELYNVMGHKMEAARMYLNCAQRLMERGDFVEVQKLADRALELEPTSLPALTLKAQSLGASGNLPQAIALFQTLPDAEAGGETTTHILNLVLQLENHSEAIALAHRIFDKDKRLFAVPYRVACSLLQASQPAEAFALLKGVRDAMIEGGEQDQYLETLSSVTRLLPGEIEPLEELVAFCRVTSNSFRLPDALSDLAQANVDAGHLDRAESLLQELYEKKPDDERIAQRLRQVRTQVHGGSAAPTEEAPAGEISKTATALAEEDAATAEIAVPEFEETPLDEDTQRYIAQALTDVDLFSSYGLTQKATNLLESVLQRAPRYAPALERLLDITLGSGNDARTAALAAALERIHSQRGDRASAERFAGLRKRYEHAAEFPAEAASPVPPRISASAAPPSTIVEAAHAPQEFTVNVIEPEPAEQAAEVDLSAEWESLSRDRATEAAASAEFDTVKAENEAAEALLESQPEQSAATEEATPEALAGSLVAASENAVPETEAPSEIVAASETHARPEDEAAPIAETAPESEAPAAEETEEFELVPAEVSEPAPTNAPVSSASGPTTSNEFLSDLAAEFGDVEEPVPARATIPAHKIPVAAAPVGQPSASVSASPQAVATESLSDNDPSNPANLNQLEEVFQEFRSDLGEMGDEDEDLETHYNLGIAYREMGLLDEAISEFQKVAKAVQRGKPFRYAMQCSTLLGLTFIDKGEPQVATVWYSRALEIPGLDQETILALRYDLGLAQELAGETRDALSSFRQVYAVNIDYRDVAERIATLQKR